VIAAALGVLVGLVLPLQTTVNARLRRSVGGSPFLAAFISFFLGTATLAVATLLVAGRLPDLSPAGSAPAWLWIGGLLGVLFLGGNIVLFPHLGSVQTVVLPIAGQVLMGLIIDEFGLFQAPRVGLTPARIGGAVLLLLGMLGAIGIAGRWARGAASDHNERHEGARVWLWRAFGIFVGMCSAAQTAINGRLGVVLGSAVLAALVSFTVGTVALLVIVLVTRTPWRLERVDQRRNPWWMWIGGSLGAAYVFGNAFLAPILGTGLTVMVVVLGMMIGSLLFDHFGLLGTRRKPATLLQVLGLLLMVAGVAAIRLL
jgi:transporter family-2 protein